MSEICAVFCVKPWIDRKNPRPKPERIEDVVLPARNKKEKDQAYLGRCKPVVLKTFVDSGYEIRATPVIVADKETLDAAFVCYVHPKGPGPKDIKRKPVNRVGVAARKRRG